MLTQIADGVLVHQSEFMQSNAVVVQGEGGLLLIDPGVLASEMNCLADDLRELGGPVTLGFSTHPHWDHLLWLAELGDAPRVSTARNAAAIQARLADPEWPEFVKRMIPSDIVERVPLNLMGRVTGLPTGTTQLRWDGPGVRILEHQAHAPGHAALLIQERGVLVAGDMLSDILIPVLDLNGSPDPVEDYLAALRLLENCSDGAGVVVPGHGAVGDAGQLKARIAQDRAYVEALRDGRDADDARLGPPAHGHDFLPQLHAWQHESLARRGPGSG